MNIVTPNFTTMIANPGEAARHANPKEIITGHDPEASRSVAGSFAAQVHTPSPLDFMRTNAEEMKVWVDRVVDKLAEKKLAPGAFVPYKAVLDFIYARVLGFDSDVPAHFDAKSREALENLKSPILSWGLDCIDSDVDLDLNLDGESSQSLKKALHVLIDLPTPLLSASTSNEYCQRHLKFILGEICGVLQGVADSN